LKRLSFVRFLLLISVFSLAACESADNGELNEADSGRVRLSASNPSADFGAYQVLINAMTTADLPPEVAQGYDIVRSEGQGLINVVVLQNGQDGATTPVGASVEVTASNLTGQLKGIDMREISDVTSIYYIGVLSVDDRETINFDFDILPNDSNQVLLLRFTQQFYTK